jgi:Flp pilus assembly protein TadB
MFLLFLLRRLSSSARIIVGVAALAAGVTAELFIRIGIVFAVVGVVFVVSGLRAKRRERLQNVQQGVEPRPFVQISE